MNSYDYIASKINALKTQYSSLRSRTDDYVFSALCIKAHFYKNPSLVLHEEDFAEMIVDGTNDGGADILLTDPNSETADLVIGQSKFFKTILNEQVLNAVRKMADFYNDMTAGHYERFNDRVRSRFRKLYAELGDESKIHFVFYTSAPKNRINIRRIETKFREMLNDAHAIEIDMFFAADMEDDIKESLLRKPSVEYGKIQIDEANNYLAYGDDAVIVNASAFSIKDLYDEHNITLLSRNLRYHIKGKAAGIDIDKAIRTTIEKDSASFWLKNNGITIICDDFEIDGCVVKLRNFSIVNGGQTTYQLHRSEHIDKQHFFWLTCKIIKTVGKTDEEKNAFSLAIAQAANSQKPITQEDLKVNAPEQMSFAKAMKAVGVFYETKRGEKVSSKEYPYAYRKTKMDEVGKLCMAAIFQMPCVSRNRKKLFHEGRYYNYIFAEKQSQVAKICKELLYINYYFNKTFKRKFKNDNENEEDASIRLPFANKARTICIAFTALAARYHQGNITDQDLKKIRAAAKPQTDSAADDMYKAVRDIGSMQSLFPKKLSENMDLYDAALDKLFTAIIEEGILAYSFACDDKPNLTANSFLQDDKNYYAILKRFWDARFAPKIKEVFAEI